jgi:hypothetical protein
MNNVDEIKFEHDMKMAKIKEEVLKKFAEYRNTISFMAADAPIEILCLPPQIQAALLTHGLLRVYDLFDCDFTKVKGLGVARIRLLATCLDKFFSML